MKKKEQAIKYIEKQRETYIVMRDNLKYNMKNDRNYQKLKNKCTDMINVLDYILINLL